MEWLQILTIGSKRFEVNPKHVRYRLRIAKIQVSYKIRSKRSYIYHQTNEKSTWAHHNVFD